MAVFKVFTFDRYLIWADFSGRKSVPGNSFSSNGAILMDLANWTDAELISIREKLHTWCVKRQEPTWANKFLNWTGFVGAFAFLTGLTDIFFGGPNATNVLLVVLGILACVSWYKGDKQRKKNISFLEKLDQEISRRRHNPSSLSDLKNRSEKVTG